MDWFWQIFTPLDADGNYSIVDQWVEVNTWTMAYTVKVIERESNKPWDANDLQHIQMMKDYTWAYLYEQMNPLTYFTFTTWLTNTCWIILCPTMYVDDQGYALDGYPLMLAKSYELSKMYQGDYSWIADPRSRKVKLEWNYFFDTLYNVLYGLFIYLAQYIFLLDTWNYVSILKQLWFYFIEPESDFSQNKNHKKTDKKESNGFEKVTWDQI